MNKYLSLIKILTLIAVVANVGDALEKCNPIRLLNGRARMQRQGRLVRFRCLKGYEFVGRRYMNCFRGQWDFERDSSVNPPMCVKPGCRASSYVNGHFLETYKGAVVSVVCNLGYTIIGPSTVYCNGHEWNQPFPECKAMNPTPSKSCSFEKDLCGWTQDPYGDWVWHRVNTTEEELCSDPESCHLFWEIGKNPGQYMLLGNSSSRIANQTERLYSPVFPAEYSNNSCFTFWYKLSGKTAGYLKVFVKPEGVELYDVIPTFWVTGHQSRSWLPGYFAFDPLQTPFQIVFEGMSLPGNESVTAFDQVVIRPEMECYTYMDVYLNFQPTEAVTEFVEFSCENRCGTTTTNATCGCGDSCRNDGDCCMDYDIYCAKEDSSTSEATTITPTESTLVTETTTNAVEEETTTMMTAANATDDSNEIQKHYDNTVGVNITTTTSVRTTTTTAATIAILNTTTTAKTTKLNTTTTATTPRLNTTTQTTARLNATTAATPRKKTSHVDLQLKVDPSRSVHVSKTRLPVGRLHGTGEDSPQSIKSESDRTTATSSGIPSGTVEAIIAVAILVVCLIIVVALIRRRRRKKTEKENMIEDSDVRYLTSDEFLDFTLARPANDDL